MIAFDTTCLAGIFYPCIGLLGLCFIAKVIASLGGNDSSADYYDSPFFHNR